VIALLAGASLAAVTFEVPPVQAVETVVIATRTDGEPLAGATVRVVYRPGLAGEHEQAIGITDGRGRITWTPSDAGIAVVKAADQEQPLRVAPGGVPEGTAGLVIATVTLAALLAGYGAWRPGAR
jgi:hypothetical protein